jgi:hypothetical protein
MGLRLAWCQLPGWVGAKCLDAWPGTLQGKLAMACMEYLCVKCGWADFGNAVIRICPLCGGRAVTFFDESPFDELDEPPEPEGPPEPPEEIEP